MAKARRTIAAAIVDLLALVPLGVLFLLRTFNRSILGILQHLPRALGGPGIMRWRAALRAGLLGSIAIVVLLAASVILLKFGQQSVDDLTPDALSQLPTWALFAFALFMTLWGTVFGLGYALIFEFVLQRAGWLFGALLGFGHATVVWLGLALLVWWFPQFAQLFPGDLSFLFQTAGGFVLMWAVHMLYGAIVGAAYGTPLHEPQTRTQVRWREV
jgi:hypothetical protein